MMRHARLLCLACCAVMTIGSGVKADGPTDNSLETVRRIPKPGVEVPEADRTELKQRLESLAAKINQLRGQKTTMTESLLPDVLIFHRAVDQALRYDEFFDAKEIPIAKTLLDQGHERADQLQGGQAPWTTKPGVVVRGYISKLDQTVQPYGVVIPASYQFDGKEKHRLDFWFHGRGEVLSEVNFLNDRSKNVGQIAPDNTIVVHPYGRYCNANKLAGEIDTLEILDSIQKQYRIDLDRVAVRGFSMGGAACWQFAAHYPDRWFAANPGAGFSETPEFLKFFQKETLNPSVYEQKLWRMYDCPGYAANFAHLPTVAYSGDMDIQKQAADIMADAFTREGMTLLHIIGPMTAHKIHPESLKQIEAKLAEWAAEGIDHSPKKIQFVTFTLKYNKMHWLTVDGLKEHWEEARVNIEPVGAETVIKTKNVSAFTIQLPKSLPQTVRIDGGKPLSVPADGSFVLHGTEWKAGKLTGLRKMHDLQGPIDDGLMDRFIFVKPSGSCAVPAVDKWVHAEMDHAITHWRRQMRGDAIVKLDKDVTADDIANSNLVIWGDAKANSVFAKIADRLPLRWTADQVSVGDRKFAGGEHAPIAIYPNPLNPKRYVVLNSGFTYREYDYLNNARQVPKLPDWAVIDVRVPPNSRYPGKIMDADFFDETWQVKPPAR